jgi:hypothetical protein
MVTALSSETCVLGLESGQLTKAEDEVNDSGPNEVTQILQEWNGDGDAPARLMPLVYEELRRLAQNYLRRERADHTLQPTALVHEAYLRLVDQSRVQWRNRAHFYGIAAGWIPKISCDGFATSDKSLPASNTRT